MRIKELLKSLTLIVLTAAMLVQTAQLMLSSQLNGENTDTGSVLRRYFTELGVGWLGGLIPSTQKTDNYAFLPERFLIPYFISVRTNSDTSVVFGNEDDLLSCSRDALPLFSILLSTIPSKSSENFETVSKQDGILFDLGRPLPSAILCSILGNNENGGDLFFQTCFFSKHNNTIRLYVKDLVTEKTYYYSINTSQGVEQYQAMFDKDSTSSGFVPAHFSVGTSMWGLTIPPGLLYADATSVSPQPIHYQNPIYSEYDKDYLTSVLTNLFAGFGVSYSSYDRKNEDGSLEFVEKRASITVFPSGQFRYTATQPSNGIEIGRFLGANVESTSRLSDALIASQLFVDSLNKEAIGGSEGTLRFERAIWDAANKTCIIEYNYCVDGLPVSVAGQSFGAQLVYDRGYFTDVTLNCREYTKNAEYSALPTLSTAMKFAALAGVKDITKFEIGYRDIGKDIINPDYIIYSKMR